MREAGDDIRHDQLLEVIHEALWCPGQYYCSLNRPKLDYLAIVITVVGGKAYCVQIGSRILTEITV